MNEKTKVIENHPIPEYRKLNLNGIESDGIISQDRFEQRYIQKGMFMIFEPKDIHKYLDDVTREASETKDIKQKSEIISKAHKTITDLYTVKVENKEGKHNTYYLKLKEENQISKSNQAEPLTNKHETQKSEDTIEKSHISNAFLYSNNFKFNKTGKEIKDQIDKVIIEEQAESEAAKSELTKMAKDIPANDLPTQESYIPSRFEGKITPVYKKYRWERCYYNENDKSSTVDYSNSTNSIKATSQEEADFCTNWNKNVEKFYDSQQEIIILQTLKNNLQDKQKYELTQEQLFALNF